MNLDSIAWQLRHFDDRGASNSRILSVEALHGPNEGMSVFQEQRNHRRISTMDSDAVDLPNVSRLMGLVKLFLFIVAPSPPPFHFVRPMLNEDQQSGF